MESGVFKIRGKVRHYDWGGFSFIPALIGDSSPQNEPTAEYWLGAHPNDPAELVEEGISLVELQQNTGETPLPFLMKVLDVRGMLSIQVHPSRKRAKIGLAEEDASNIPRNHPNRNYKDANHKPELMFALSDFWMLHGLRSKSEIVAEFHSRPSCEPLLEILENQGMEGLVAFAVSTDHPLIKGFSEAFIEESIHSVGVEDKRNHDFWIRRWLQANPGVDRGILMILLMNLLNLRPGEAAYQPDGLIHAYLEGQNIEIMANSDNVLRAGLTVKHIDAPELLKIARLDSTNPDDFKVNAVRDSDGIRDFAAPFEDFHLREVEIPPNSSISLDAPRSQILLYLSGESIEISDGEKNIDMIPGEACYVAKDTSIQFSNNSFRTAQVFIGS